LEKNEGAGLYTPRSLIRKPKIYTTLEYVWLANFAGQIAELATGLGRLALAKRDGDDGSVTRPGLYQPLTSIPLDQWERRKTNGRDSDVLGVRGNYEYKYSSWCWLARAHSLGL